MELKPCPFCGSKKIERCICFVKFKNGNVCKDGEGKYRDEYIYEILNKGEQNNEQIYRNS